MTKAILFTAMLLVLGIASAEDRFESVAKQAAVDTTSANQTAAAPKKRNSAIKKAAVTVKKTKATTKHIKATKNTAKSRQIANSAVKKNVASTTLDLLR